MTATTITVKPTKQN